MRALWSRLTNLVRGPKPPPPACYDPERDPAIRALRLQRRQAERATRRILRGHNPIEQTVSPPRKGAR